MHSDGQTQQMPACQNFAPPLCFLMPFFFFCMHHYERRETVTKSVVFNVLSGKRASTRHFCLWFLCFWLHVLEKWFLSDHCSKLNISVHQIPLWNQTCGCWWIPALPARSSTTRLMLTRGLCVNLLRKAKFGPWRLDVPWQQSSTCFPAMMVLSRESCCNQFPLSTRSRTMSSPVNPSRADVRRGP